jgi:hypothetical protein
MTAEPQLDYETELANEVSNYYANPLGFVLSMFPWGEEGGPLASAKGPDKNQREFLKSLGKHVRERKFDGSTPVAPIRMSVSSCHGSGKSTMGAWIAWWILSTRPMSIGTVSAGTYQQLEERTWADIMHWGRMCKTAHWFDIQANGIFSNDPKLAEKWKITPKTSIEARAQAFAGQHAATSTSWFLFDEASEIPETVWTTAYGGLTDGEPMMFAWGQMIRNAGEFYNVCFGDASTRWDSRVFDGRDSAFTNKQLIEEWREEYGDDSDWYRVRVLGLPPRASELQFIGQDLIDGARRRDHIALADEPLIWGYDAANGGLAHHCFWARRGLDAKSIPPIFLPGDTPRDTVVAKAVDLLTGATTGVRAAAMFGDQAFGSVILERVRQMGYTNVFEVNFGSTSPDPKCLNVRALIWMRMREWMRLGAIPDNEKLTRPFMDPGFHHRSGKLVLESKQDMAKRRVKSPDGPDALAATFFQTVAPQAVQRQSRPQAAANRYSWMGALLLAFLPFVEKIIV